tara:strand:- start:1688 stop:2077 length:390 start_codon:yes stop_codon:yes gene_type:complete
MSQCAAQLWERNMAEINYVEFHNFEVDCSEITGDPTDIAVIMQNSDVSLRDLCESEFGCHPNALGCHPNTEERDELIAYLNELAGRPTFHDSGTIKDFIARCNDFEILLELMSTVTANLFRVAQSRGQL